MKVDRGQTDEAGLGKRGTSPKSRACVRRSNIKRQQLGLPREDYKDETSALNIEWAPTSSSSTCAMETLPVELVECIVELLDFPSICALRATSRDLAAKTSQGRFRTFIGHTDKSLCVTEDALRTFACVTRPGGIGCCLERLILVGVYELEYVFDDHPSSRCRDDWSEQIGMRQVKILAEAFRNVKKNSEFRKLTSLSMEVLVRTVGGPTDPHCPRCQAASGQHPCRNPCCSWSDESSTIDDANTPVESPAPVPDPRTAWSPAEAMNYWGPHNSINTPRWPKWARASHRGIAKICARTFQIALGALSRTGLRVDELSIFANQLDCALPCDRLVLLGDDATQWTAFQKTRHLALRVSHTYGQDAPPSPPQERAVGSRTRSMDYDPLSEAAGKSNVLKILRFLQAFPNLEHLEIRWHSLTYYKIQPGRMIEQDFLQSINERQVSWPRLRQVTFTGLRTTNKPLLDFLRRNKQLQSITIEGLFLGSGNARQLRPVLNFLTREMENLVFLRLAEIWAERELDFISGPQWQSYQCEGEQVKQHIRYALPPPRNWGACIEDFRDPHERSQKYGSPF